MHAFAEPCKITVKALLILPWLVTFVPKLLGYFCCSIGSPFPGQHHQPVSYFWCGSAGSPVCQSNLGSQCRSLDQTCLEDIRISVNYIRVPVRVLAHVHACVSVLTEAPQSRVDAVWPVCCCHYNHVSSLLQTIHQGQEL